MRVIAVSGFPRFRFGTEENGARAKDFAFAVIGRIRSWDGPRLRRRSDCQRSVVSM